MRLFIFLTLPFYLLDQVTKYLVLRSIDPRGLFTVIPHFFFLVNVTNSGAAFGSFANRNGFFIVLSFVALIIALSLLVRQRLGDSWNRFALALLLAGILGNLTDRLIHGHVTDFLLFYLPNPFGHPYPWPAFNVADSCICIAASGFIIHSFRQPAANREA
jgi:signal peptidase II